MKKRLNRFRSGGRNRQRGFAGLVVLLAVGVLAIALSGPRAGAPREVLARLAASSDPAWRVGVQVSPAAVAVGSEGARVRVESARSGYLVLVQAGTDGRRLDVIFPNALDNRNELAAGSTELPREDWRFAARGPAGEGALLALVCREAVNGQALLKESAAGLSPALAGCGAAIANWIETDGK